MDFCRSEYVPNVTTHDQVNNTLAPILFHIGRDPGEKYPIRYVQSFAALVDSLWLFLVASFVEVVLLFYISNNFGFK